MQKNGLRNKKIAFFLGLPHHSRFIFPIAEAARKEGADILFFTTGGTDYPYERDMLKRGYKFKFLTDYANESTRGRIKRTIDELLDEWIKLSFIWDGLRHWILADQNRSLTRNVEELCYLDRMINVERPDMFLALNEMNPWGNQIGHLSRKYGIPFVTLQEGDYAYNTQLLVYSIHAEYSTANLLWGQETEDIITMWKGAPDKLVVTGNTHLDSAMKSYSAPSEKHKIRKELGIESNKKIVSLFPDIEWGVSKNKEVWDHLLNGLDSPDLLCVIKWHPLVKYDFYLEMETKIRGILPSAIMLNTYDPYKVLSISDYCVVLGKTTVGVEALAFGKPLFTVPTADRSEDYYIKLGVAQSVYPLGNWELLFKTIQSGIPDDIKRNADNYVNHAFYKLDGKAVERALEVIGYILQVKQRQCGTRAAAGNNMKPGRISFIIPSGNDAEALLATLTSLSQNVNYPDWEVIITLNDAGIKGLLSGLSGDVLVVEAACSRLPELYNRGADLASGEYFVFIKPGVAFFKGDGLFAMEEGVAGIPLRNRDNTPYCLGIGFDFNQAPYMIRVEADDQSVNTDRRDAVGGGLLGIHRNVHESVGGFDERIADHLIEADMCLAAKEKGYPITYLPECLGFVYKETFIRQAAGGRQQSDEGDEEWKGRIGFFAKWCGKLPKDDDFIKYAGDLLKV